MGKPLFSPEELAELAAADAELDETFAQTQEEIEASRLRDREAALDGMDNKERKRAAQQAAYREANKDKIAAQQAAWFKNNREKWNAYQRERRRKRNSSI